MITAEERVRGSLVIARTGTRGHVDPVTESHSASLARDRPSIFGEAQLAFAPVSSGSRTDIKYLQAISW